MRYLTKIWQFYRDGFRQMSIGRVLWLIIIIKVFLILMLYLVRAIFFPEVTHPTGLF